MKRIISVFAVMAVVAAMLAAMALPALAAPKKQGAGCKGLLNAIEKQTLKRSEGPNPVLVQKAIDRGCLPAPTPPAG